VDILVSTEGPDDLDDLDGLDGLDGLVRYFLNTKNNMVLLESTNHDQFSATTQVCLDGMEKGREKGSGKGREKGMVKGSGKGREKGMVKLKKANINIIYTIQRICIGLVILIE